MNIILCSQSKALSKYWKDCLVSHKTFITFTHDELFELLSNKNIDILMLDVSSFSPGHVEKLLALYPNKQILLLSKNPNFDEGKLYLELGIKGYINAYAQGIHMNDAVNSIKNGNIWLYPEFIQSMLLAIAKTKKFAYEHEAYSPLSKKEKEILALIHDGLTNKEIAYELKISLSTVKTHTSHMYEKLGVKDRIELVLLAQG